MSLCAQCDPISAVQKLRRASKRASRGKDELASMVKAHKKNKKCKTKIYKYINKIYKISAVQKFKRSSRGKDELPHCTVGLSLALRISKITKSRHRFCSILIETI